MANKQNGTLQEIGERLESLLGDISGITTVSYGFPKDGLTTSLLPAIVIYPDDFDSKNSGRGEKRVEQSWYIIVYVGLVEGRQQTLTAAELNACSPFQFSCLQALDQNHYLEDAGGDGLVADFLISEGGAPAVLMQDSANPTGVYYGFVHPAMSVTYITMS